MKIAEVECKNALVKSRIEGLDYALNPYTGCQHACVYCYAEFMKKYTNHKEDWGEFVDVKINVAERLRQQIKKTRPGTVQLGTVTDAYQPLEERFRLTRRCLEVLADSDFPVTIQTKSDLVLRDVDILRKIKDKEVGLTITCSDPEVERLFEPGTSNLDRRLDALKGLRKMGIPTYVFFGPILPFFSDHADSLLLLFKRLQKTGVRKIYLDKMNYLKGKRKKISRILVDNFPHALRFYDGVVEREEKYTEWLKATLASTLSRFPFEPEILF
ncbi:MAG: radical SAM protein [Candidatus Zixiibacteriota bacterium]|nr:MAG: radical SAM protein [candidate division Zixibacteria bacterium]